MKRVRLGSVGSNNCTAWMANWDGSPPLFFVHGSAGDHRQFMPQIEHFSAKMPVLAIDLPGHGQSAPSSQDYSIQSLAQTLTEFADEMGISQLIWIGHSLGASIGLRASVLRPDLVKGLVMIDAPILFPEQVALGLAPWAEKLRNCRDQSALKLFAEQAFFQPDDSSAFKAAILENMLQFDPKLFLTLFEETGRYQAADDLKTSSCPVLFAQATVPTDLDLLQKLSPQLRLQRIERTSHYPHLERPEQINPMIEEFVLSLSAR
jgi:pyruvate dehydrogenase E2 component (dihydrolipoamide acetyltransferase)